MGTAMMDMMMGALMGGGMPKGKGAPKGAKGQAPKGKAAPKAKGEGDPESGYVGIAITRDQRIRKNSDKLMRLVSKMEDLAAEIEETEDKLTSFGVDVEELYESWDYVDNPEEAYEGVADDGDDGDDGSSGAGGVVIGHVDDLSDEELDALQAGELGVDPGVFDFDDEGDAEVHAGAWNDDESDDDEPDDDEDVIDVDPSTLFPKGNQSGRGFSGASVLGSMPWIGRAKFGSVSKAGIASPIEAFAAEARRSIMNNANRMSQEPIWIYQQTMGIKAIMYYVAVGQPAPGEAIAKWNKLPGYGKVKLVATANGAR